MIERRDVLKHLGALGVGLFAASRIEPAEAKEFEKEDSFLKVVARSVMDIERVVYQQLGMPMSYEEQLAFYEKSTEAVEAGVDPFEKDFWKQVKERQAERLPTRAASVLDFKDKLA